MSESSDDKMVERINKLLAKAESTNSVPEAEALFAKAQELMSKYAIDAAILAMQRTGKTEEIISKTIKVGTDRSIQNLFWIVAKYNDCQTFYVSSLNNRLRQKHEHICIYGTQRDIEFVEILYANLLMFCQRSLADMRKMGAELGTNKFKGKAYGHSYRMGFATSVGAKMKLARDVARGEANAENPGTELVLRSKADAIRAKLEQENPDLTPRTGVATVRHYDAYVAGANRGAQADVSGGRNNLRERPSLTGK